MKASHHKRPHKLPSSTEKETPFFSASHAPPEPFFTPAPNAIAQPKLTVSDPNSTYEKEADAMAAAVVNQTEKPQKTAQSETQVHRQGMEEEEAQAKPELMRAGEEKEEEAQTKPELMRAGEEKEEEAQAKPELMRVGEEKEEEAQAKPELMRVGEEKEEEAQAKSEPGKVPKTSLSQRLQKTKGQGQPLSAHIQEQMGQSFKHDFSDVTIHTGKEAIQLAKALKAQAFTHGQDIYFNEGKYNPESSTGKELLAHELTHIVQQNKNSLSD